MGDSILYHAAQCAARRLEFGTVRLVAEVSIGLSFGATKKFEEEQTGWSTGAGRAADAELERRTSKATPLERRQISQALASTSGMRSSRDALQRRHKRGGIPRL
jgi:hypothetical protein